MPNDACNPNNFSGWGLDGQALHDKISPACWCITKDDLRHLRACISQRVGTMDIVPNCRDEFDPSDDKVGPNMYTVVDSLIKPLTSKAGKMSWALLRRPEGLKCDVFITHGWVEGAFELIDKMLASWPVFKKAAWCCILANPQNLDISRLICEPRTSPFAKALNVASHMMVVPNAKVSIYSRIWCAYEAHLAYSSDKTIFTAVEPYMNRLVCAFLLVAASVIGGFSIGMAFGSFSVLTTIGSALGCLGIILAIMSQSVACSDTSWQAVNVIGAFSTSCGLGFAVHVFLANACRPANGPCDWNEGSGAIFGSDYPMASLLALTQPCLVIFFLASELDRSYVMGARRGAAQLHKDYVSVRDAASSNPEDRRAILADIGDNMEAVDDSITVLITAGMSTAALRRAARLGVVVAGAADRRMAIGWAALATWLLLTLWTCFELGQSCYDLGNDDIALDGEFDCFHLYHRAAFFVNLILMLIYASILSFSENDRRAFMISALFRLEVFMALLGPACVYLARKLVPRDQIHSVDEQRWLGLTTLLCFSAALILCIASAGLSGLASVPYIGVHLAQVLGPNWQCCRQCQIAKHLEDEHSDTSDVEMSVSS